MPRRVLELGRNDSKYGPGALGNGLSASVDGLPGTHAAAAEAAAARRELLVSSIQPPPRPMANAAAAEIGSSPQTDGQAAGASLWRGRWHQVQLDD